MLKYLMHIQDFTLTKRLLLICSIILLTLGVTYIVSPSYWWIVLCGVNLCIVALLTKTNLVSLNFGKKHTTILLLIFVIDFLITIALDPPFRYFRAVASVVVAPLLEEILFRGLVIDGLRGSTRRRVILSSLIFGVWHIKNIFILQGGVVNQFVTAAFIIGPFLGWLKLRYKSLYPSILTHSVFNTTVTLFPFFTLVSLYLSWFLLTKVKKPIIT